MKHGKEMMMNGSWQMFLGALSTGVTLTVVGCFASPQLNSERFGQGGSATTGTAGGVPCTSIATCEDDNPCTTDACTNGFCSYAPLDMDPGPGSTVCVTITCSAGAPTKTIHDGKPCGESGKLKCAGEVCAGCTNNMDCGPTDECQTSTCQPDTTCTFEFAPIGTPVTTNKRPDDKAGDCMTTACNGTGTKLLLADDMDVPDDGIECTEGHCMKGNPAPFTPSALGTPCSEVGKFCNATQSCVVCATDANCGSGSTCVNESLCVSCSDGIQNNGEAGVDCGGPCAVKCKDGTPCANNASDCISGNCVDGVCCETVCNGICVACNNPMKEGTCSPLAKGHDDTNPMCSGIMTCTTGANCVGDLGKKHYGDSCTSAMQCFSGICDGLPPTCK